LRSECVCFVTLRWFWGGGGGRTRAPRAAHTQNARRRAAAAAARGPLAGIPGQLERTYHKF